MGKMRARQRMRRKFREEDLEEEQVLDEATKLAQSPTAMPSPADKALELQKTAGNRAVGAALDRFASPFLPSNAPAVAAWPKHPEARFDDDLVVPIESAQDPRAGGGGPGSGRSEREDPNGPGELTITTPGGDFVVELHKAVVGAKHFDKVVIVLPSGAGGIVIILYDVYISSGHISGNGHAWQLSYSKREFSNAPPPSQ